MFKKVLTAAMFLLTSLPAIAAGDGDAGQQKSAACMACHGADGKAAAPIYPNLAGQHEEYLGLALRAYKSGARSGGQAEVMKAFVAGLSEEDIDDLAAYYAGLKP